MLDFSVSDARFLSREDRQVKLALCVCETLRNDVVLRCVSAVSSSVLNHLFCLFGRLVFCVWAIGVESDKEWEKE